MHAQLRKVFVYGSALFVSELIILVKHIARPVIPCLYLIAVIIIFKIKMVYAVLSTLAVIIIKAVWLPLQAGNVRLPDLYLPPVAGGGCCHSREPVISFL